jgi:hypothetical protein
MAPAATAAVFVVCFVVAWSPLRRSNAGISWVEHPEFAEVPTLVQ